MTRSRANRRGNKGNRGSKGVWQHQAIKGPGNNAGKGKRKGGKGKGQGRQVQGEGRHGWQDREGLPAAAPARRPGADDVVREVRGASNQEAKPWCCTCFEAAQGMQISNEASSGIWGPAAFWTTL